MAHTPVLLKEVLQYLDPKPNENFIDCTMGEGGHAAAILEKTGPSGKVLGIDWDEKQIENCKLKIGNFNERLILVVDSYTNLKEIVAREEFSSVAGILLDLGMSSWHLEKSNRGFSFQRNEPLNMVYAKDQTITAEEILNNWQEQDIEKILREYGEEKFSRKIAKEIIKERKIRLIKNTFQLVEIIKKAVPQKYLHSRIHFATRTFQALRITANKELDNLKKVLPQALEILLPEGRLAAISFHSLEDRIVKNFLKENKEKIRILTKKPISPSEEEIINNSRSRSAKLRVLVKIRTCLRAEP